MLAEHTLRTQRYKPPPLKATLMAPSPSRLFSHNLFSNCLLNTETPVSALHTILPFFFFHCNTYVPSHLFCLSPLPRSRQSEIKDYGLFCPLSCPRHWEQGPTLTSARWSVFSHVTEWLTGLLIPHIPAALYPRHGTRVLPQSVPVHCCPALWFNSMLHLFAFPWLSKVLWTSTVLFNKTL